MNREEARGEYQKEVSEYLRKSREALGKNLEKEEKELTGKLCRELGQLLTTSADKGQVQYIQISLLRSWMDENIYKILLSVHNEQYFLDRNPLMLTVDASSVFAPLHNARELLYKTLEYYHGKVEKYEADRLIRETAMVFFKKQADRFRKRFWDLDHWLPEDETTQGKRLIVKWGEFQETSETIFLTDTREKSQEQFLKYNEKNTVEQWEPQYVYQSWEKVQFAEMSAEKMNLLFGVFRGCRMEHCQWVNCLTHGAVFKNSDLEQVVFAGCDLSGCDFRDTMFTQVRFVQCNLSEADFTRVDLESVQFSGSNLEGAKFSRNSLASKGLDARQLQQIRIEEVPYVF